MQPGVDRIKLLLDGAGTIRGRRARIEHLVDGFADFLVKHRHYVMADTDPAAKRDKANEAAKLRQCALTVLFGENPTGAERLALGAAYLLPDCVPELADLTDEELHEALHATLLRLLRVPSASRE